MGGLAVTPGSWLTDPAGVPILAFLTTLHCAILILRNDRCRGGNRLSLLPCVVFTATPWVLRSPAHLVMTLAAHVAWFAACERYLLGAREPETAAPQAASTRSGPSFRSMTILAVIEQTAEIRSFRFTRPQGFTFDPGQFVMVRVTINGAQVVRCYSIVSAPATRDYLEIGVRRQGVVSRHLHETLVRGATLDVTGPGGTFVYPTGNAPVVLIAGGIGITPLLSMLRHGLAAEPWRRFTLMLSVKTAAHIPFAGELRALARSHPQLRVVVALTAGSSDPRFLSGRLDRAAIESVVVRPEECVYMLCGPSPMIEEMRRALAATGVPDPQVFFERFETAVRDAAAASEQVRITLQQRRRTVVATGAQSVLEAAEAANEELPSMCRAGVCGTCRVRLVAGRVDGDFDALDAADREAGFILACMARPRTDCVVEA